MIRDFVVFFALLIFMYNWTGKVCLVHEIIIFSCRTVCSFRTSFAQYAPIAQNVTWHLKMYFLLNMGDFPAGHVSLLYFTERHIAAFLTCMVLTTWILDVKRADISTFSISHPVGMVEHQLSTKSRAVLVSKGRCAGNTVITWHVLSVAVDMLFFLILAIQPRFLMFWPRIWPVREYSYSIQFLFSFDSILITGPGPYMFV